MCKLEKLKTLRKHPKDIESKAWDMVKLAYKDVEDIDLFTGGTIEKRVQGGVVGQTFACIIGQQFR